MFNEFKISSENRSRETIDTLCTNTRGSFALQNHQKFLKAYISSSLFEEENRLLLFHGLGSGKTCSAISIASAFRTKHPNAKIIVVTPASLVPNFYKEMKGMCGVTQFSQLQGVRKNASNSTNPCVVENVEQVLNDIIQVMSYQKFLKNQKSLRPFNKQTLFVIDEVQNIISETGSMYASMSKVLSNTKAAVVLLSGTPIFDKPNELAMIGNLLHTKKQLPVRLKDFLNTYGVETRNNVSTVLNEQRLEAFFENKVSYFRGSNPVAYPKKNEYDVYCPMSGFQYAGYLNSVGDEAQYDTKYGEMSTTFLIGPRQCSNTVYPNGDLSINTAKRYEKTPFSSKKYAVKFHTCANKLLASSGPVFVYSNFVSSCGINTFASVLRNEFKFDEVTPGVCPTSKGKRPRYAVFRTGQSDENTRILQLFNSPKNKNGGLIKAILGSPAMKEGVTLLRTREVHLLDPYWNRSRIEQIMGRGVRFCSHKDLPEKDRLVDVYHYYAVTPDTPGRLFLSNTNNKQLRNTQTKTVDLHIRDMGFMKEKYNKLYEDVLKRVAIDCSLFKHANEPPVINCKQSRGAVPNQPRREIVNRSTTPRPSTNVSVRVNKLVNKEPSKLRADILRPNVVVPKPAKKRLHFEARTSAFTGFASSEKKPVAKGCPKSRQVDPKTSACPTTHPFKRANKYGTPCCYKNKGKGVRKVLGSNDASALKNMRSCMSLGKYTLKKMAKPFGYTSGPITKKRLCELMMV
jgi:hypothetical protein